MDNIILKIVKAEYVENYVLRLTFNNEEVRLMDFAPLIINFCRVTLPKLDKELKEKGKDNEGDES